MDSTKLQTNDIEALIAIAQSKPAKEEPVNLSSVEQWIISCDIKPGEHAIKPYQLWYAYEAWAQFPIKQKEFFKEFKHVFKGVRKRTTDNVYYLVDPSSFDTSLDSYFEMCARKRTEKETRRKSRDAKKAQG